MNARAARWLRLSEPCWVFLFFLVYAGQLTPAVNEAHYLCKARHYWDPSWCPHDQFMNSADTHLAFYWVFGWMTNFFSLATCAWIGRFVVWAALAYSWTHLSRTVCTTTGCALLSAALATSLCEVTNLAGEWFVGGVEGKSLAWAFVFLALRQLVRANWVMVWPLLGLAIAFHALVGGWAWAIAMGILLQDLVRPRGVQPIALRRMLPSFTVGLAAAAIGMAPALAMDWNVLPAVAAEAHAIQVNERIAHHLRLSGMSWHRMVRFALVVAVWLTLSTPAHLSQPLQRLRRFVNGALLISLTGAGIELFGYLSGISMASLQRFYWFRMSDVLVPCGLVLTVVARTAEFPAAAARRRALAIALIALLAWVPARFIYLRLDRRPHAVRQARPFRLRQASAIAARYEDWRAACEWIRQFTPTDATFLCPTNRQTFKWFANRGEFATWKGMPQDAQSIVAWRQRRREIEAIALYEPDGVAPVAAVQELARKYGLTHVLLEKGWGRLDGTLPLVYRNEHFEIYRFANGGTGEE